MSARAYPVCSPGLWTDERPLSVPSDLRLHTLLDEDSDGPWREWLTAARVEGIDAGRGPRFDDGHLALAAAEAGQGVALADEPLAAPAIATGRLVRLFTTEIGTDKAYWLVYPSSSPLPAKVAAFRDWLMMEVER